MRRLVPSIVGTIATEFSIEEAPEAEVDFEFRRQVLLAFRETLNNAARHAHTDRIRVRMGGDEAVFWFETRDWGRGFDPDGDLAGHGVANLRKRAELLDGKVSIESVRGQGTTVLFSAPHESQGPSPTRMKNTLDTISVWLVEDNQVYRHGLARAIETAEGMACNQAFADAESALHALGRGGRPDVILLDVGLPGMDGLTALRQLSQTAPETRVVLLTVFNDADKIFDAVCAGANGYLLKTASTQQVIDSIRQAAKGGAPMDPDVAERVLRLFNRFARTPSPQPESYGLSPREKQILEQMAQGLVNKEIAEVLDISPHTVINHLRSIYGKLHVNTNTGAVAKAIREGLV